MRTVNNEAKTLFRWAGLAGLAASMLLFASAARSQQAAQKPAAAATKPGADLSGVWYPSTSRETLGAATPDNPGQQFVWLDNQGKPIPFPKDLLTPWGQDRLKKNHPSGDVASGETRTAYDSDDPDFACFPAGVPRIYLFLYPMQTVQTSGQLLMLFEYGHNIRQIFTDGRGHAPDEEPTWLGDSIGHWEGDTLVVETTNQNDKTWFGYGGQPHSEELKVEERIRRPDHDSLTIDITMTDPKAYKEPLHTRKKYILKPSWNLKEYVCEDNMVNFKDYEKKTSTGTK
jgi:hypothetical protein